MEEIEDECTKVKKQDMAVGAWLDLHLSASFDNSPTQKKRYEARFEVRDHCGRMDRLSSDLFQHFKQEHSRSTINTSHYRDALSNKVR